MINQYYTRDYYKINGETTLHKFKYDPFTLEKVLDCYWQIDRKFVLSVLVPSATYENVDTKIFKEMKRNASLKMPAAAVGNTNGMKIIVDED